MNTARQSPALQEKYPALARSFNRANRAKGLALKAATAPPLAPPPVDPEARFVELETLTASHRQWMAWRHTQRMRRAWNDYQAALENWEAYQDERGVELGALTRLEQSGAAWIVGESPPLLPTGEIDETCPPMPIIPGELVDELRAAKTSHRWHEGRAKGQRERFVRVRTCGERVIVASCKACGEDQWPVPEGCGVRRVCDRCDVEHAIERRARFGRARGHLMIDAHRYGLTRSSFPGGRYSEKMLTLTVPHGTLATSDGLVRHGLPEKQRAAKERRVGQAGVHDGPSWTDVDARIRAAFLAWPLFLRSLNEFLSDTAQEHAAYHRAFEWTPAVDGIGHPHFHVYIWSQFIPIALVREWWADALRSVGWRVERVELRCVSTWKAYGWHAMPCASTPKRAAVCTTSDEIGGARLRRSDARTTRRRRCETAPEGEGGRSKVVVDLRELRSFDRNAASELMKGGHRSALTLSQVRFAGDGPGGDAFAYAEGWTIGDVIDFCAPKVVADLYCALEGRRLSQASQGFFEDDEPPMCLCCGADSFRVRLVTPAHEGAREVFAAVRGPPE